MAFCLLASVAAAEEVVPYVPTTSIVISIPEQKLTVLRDGCFWKKYPISTSKYGIGDAYSSYKTPTGHLRVCEKIGEDLAAGSVIKQRHATGEVLPANSPGRDPIVTRILWLDGLEEQNHNARARGIYIHGTTEEGKIGMPVSYGCIRMRSKDVQEVFEEASIDTQVSIIPEKFPHYAKYTPPKPKIIVVAKPTPAPVATKPAAIVAAARPAPTTPASVVASTANVMLISTKKTAQATPAPAPIAEYRPPAAEPTVVINHSSVTVSTVPYSEVAQAFEGSILSAGLPDGPKIVTFPKPTTPKDVTRFGELGSAPAQAESLSLQNPGPNAEPAVITKDQDAADSAAKSDSNIAFRTRTLGSKPKQ